MADSVFHRLLPYCLPAMACGNLLCLNLLLAPSVFAHRSPSEVPEGDREPLAEARVSAEPVAEARETESAAGIESPIANTEDRSRPPAGRCDDSASHEALEFLTFGTNEDGLDSIARVRLEALVDSLEDRRAIWLDGHADSRGDSTYNDDLSLRRAQSVSQVLVDLGIPESRIRVRSFGETSPRSGPRRKGLWTNRQTVLCVGKAGL